ncbi:probable ATP-dependent RNA helicase DHX35 isoform X1 [Lucilia cuprina]|uniref:probable ATP-dependent RNA helicase DHX35 isoform X1 n=1 Tax=Lucilia cuprina TaxID=7375 RepID=UPI001F06C297|nr:probable ATP-dependent RNA helicase DHX35 isoform X1 [Lucilia cuprina]
MKIYVRLCVYIFIIKDNEEELLAGYQNIRHTNPSDVSDKKKSKNNIVFCIEKYQITILATEFGIGTLELPQYLEDLGWTQKGKIAVIDHNNDEAQTEMFTANPYDNEDFRKINYISNEKFLKELFMDPILTNYGVILVNNVHRRHVLTDTVLALLKKIIRKRSTLKLVLVSNTKEANFFADYFNTHKRNKTQQLTCAVLSIDDVDLKQSIFYLQSPCPDYISKSIDTLRNIHEKQTLDGDVLVYLADDDEINQAIELLKNYINMDHIKNVNYFKLSHINGEKQSVFFPKQAGKRNVIFTKDLHQDSVTQDRISYDFLFTVIDCGFMQLNWFQAESNKSRKITVPVSKFVAELRANWRNKYRTAKVFRLYTKEDFNNLPERSVAKMRRTDLCSVILYLKTLAVDNILRFDFPSPPPAKNVLSALETLYALGALDDQGQLTNPLGFIMADAPFCPRLSKALFNSIEFQCSEEILTIVAMLQLESVFIITTNHMADSHKQVARRAFEAAEGDLITLLNVYTAFVENDKSKEFCRKYYLNYRNLMRAHKLRNYFASTLLNKYKMSLISCHGDVERILKCIASGYFMNVAYLHASGVYRGLRCKTDLYIDRDSAIYSLPQPKYLIYCNLYENTKTFMNNVTVIKEEWLSELAPHYYETK